MANGLRVIADHSITDCPPSDALIVTGGPGWVAQMRKPETLSTSCAAMRVGRVVAGVCTGGMILAAAGILDGCKATTKREIAGAEVPPVRMMRERHPLIDVTERGESCRLWSGRHRRRSHTRHRCDTAPTGAASRRERRERDGAHHGILARMASKPRRPAGHRAVTRTVRARANDGRRSGSTSERCALRAA